MDLSWEAPNTIYFLRKYNVLVVYFLYPSAKRPRNASVGLPAAEASWVGRTGSVFAPQEGRWRRSAAARRTQWACSQRSVGWIDRQINGDGQMNREQERHALCLLWFYMYVPQMNKFPPKKCNWSNPPQKIGWSHCSWSMVWEYASSTLAEGSDGLVAELGRICTGLKLIALRATWFVLSINNPD